MTTATADHRAWAADIAVMIAGLPTMQADALRLSYFEHLDEHEIAARMGLALKYTRVACAEGLRNLGRALQAAPRT